MADIHTKDIDKRTRKRLIHLDVKKRLPTYTLGEELLSAISHGVGAAFGVVALILMLIKAVSLGGTMQILTAAIYGAAIIILFLNSTLYHALAPNRAKLFFRVMDHCTIYFLIAGTYTPYALLTLGGTLGWALFAYEWGMTILGVVLNAIDMKRFRLFSNISYLLMGWTVVLFIGQLMASMASLGLILLLVGGAFYTLGFVFYVMKRYKYMHAIWHFFVLFGSISHFCSVYFFVL